MQSPNNMKVFLLCLLLQKLALFDQIWFEMELLKQAIQSELLSHLEDKTMRNRYIQVQFELSHLWIETKLFT